MDDAFSRYGQNSPHVRAVGLTRTSSGPSRHSVTTSRKYFEASSYHARREAKVTGAASFLSQSLHLDLTNEKLRSYLYHSTQFCTATPSLSPSSSSQRASSLPVTPRNKATVSFSPSPSPLASSTLSPTKQPTKQPICVTPAQLFPAEPLVPTPAPLPYTHSLLPHPQTPEVPLAVGDYTVIASCAAPLPTYTHAATVLDHRDADDNVYHGARVRPRSARLCAYRSRAHDHPYCVSLPLAGVDDTAPAPSLTPTSGTRTPTRSPSTSCTSSSASISYVTSNAFTSPTVPPSPSHEQSGPYVHTRMWPSRPRASPTAGASTHLPGRPPVGPHASIGIHPMHAALRSQPLVRDAKASTPLPPHLASLALAAVPALGPASSPVSRFVNPALLGTVQEAPAHTPTAASSRPSPYAQVPLPSRPLAVTAAPHARSAEGMHAPVLSRAPLAYARSAAPTPAAAHAADATAGAGGSTTDEYCIRVQGFPTDNQQASVGAIGALRGAPCAAPARARDPRHDDTSPACLRDSDSFDAAHRNTLPHSFCAYPHASTLAPPAATPYGLRPPSAPLPEPYADTELCTEEGECDFRAGGDGRYPLRPRRERLLQSTSSCSAACSASCLSSCSSASLPPPAHALHTQTALDQYALPDPATSHEPVQVVFCTPTPKLTPEQPLDNVPAPKPTSSDRQQPPVHPTPQRRAVAPGSLPLAPSFLRAGARTDNVRALQVLRSAVQALTRTSVTPASSASSETCESDIYVGTVGTTHLHQFQGKSAGALPTHAVAVPRAPPAETTTQDTLQLAFPTARLVCTDQPLADAHHARPLQSLPLAACFLSRGGAPARPLVTAAAFTAVFATGPNLPHSWPTHAPALPAINTSLAPHPTSLTPASNTVAALQTAPLPVSDPAPSPRPLSRLPSTTPLGPHQLAPCLSLPFAANTSPVLAPPHHAVPVYGTLARPPLADVQPHAAMLAQSGAVFSPNYLAPAVGAGMIVSALSPNGKACPGSPRSSERDYSSTQSTLSSAAPTSTSTSASPSPPSSQLTHPLRCHARSPSPTPSHADATPLRALRWRPVVTPGTSRTPQSRAGRLTMQLARGDRDCATTDVRVGMELMRDWRDVDGGEGDSVLWCEQWDRHSAGDVAGQVRAWREPYAENTPSGDEEMALSPAPESSEGMLPWSAPTFLPSSGDQGYASASAPAGLAGDACFFPAMYSAPHAPAAPWATSPVDADTDTTRAASPPRDSSQPLPTAHAAPADHHTHVSRLYHVAVDTSARAHVGSAVATHMKTTPPYGSGPLSVPTLFCGGSVPAPTFDGAAAADWEGEIDDACLWHIESERALIACPNQPLFKPSLSPSSTFPPQPQPSTPPAAHAHVSASDAWPQQHYPQELSSSYVHASSDTDAHANASATLRHVPVGAHPACPNDRVNAVSHRPAHGGVFDKSHYASVASSPPARVPDALSGSQWAAEGYVVEDYRADTAVGTGVGADSARPLHPTAHCAVNGYAAAGDDASSISSDARAAHASLWALISTGARELGVLGISATGDAKTVQAVSNDGHAEYEAMVLWHGLQQLLYALNCADADMSALQATHTPIQDTPTAAVDDVLSRCSTESRNGTLHVRYVVTPAGKDVIRGHMSALTTTPSSVNACAAPAALAAYTRGGAAHAQRWWSDLSSANADANVGGAHLCVSLHDGTESTPTASTFSLPTGAFAQPAELSLSVAMAHSPSLRALLALPVHLRQALRGALRGLVSMPMNQAVFPRLAHLLALATAPTASVPCVALSPTAIQEPPLPAYMGASARVEGDIGVTPVCAQPAWSMSPTEAADDALHRISDSFRPPNVMSSPAAPALAPVSSCARADNYALTEIRRKRHGDTDAHLEDQFRDFNTWIGPTSSPAESPHHSLAEAMRSHDFGQNVYSSARQGSDHGLFASHQEADHLPNADLGAGLDTTGQRMSPAAYKRHKHQHQHAAGDSSALLHVVLGGRDHAAAMEVLPPAHPTLVSRSPAASRPTSPAPPSPTQTPLPYTHARLEAALHHSFSAGRPGQRASPTLSHEHLSWLPRDQSWPPRGSPISAVRAAAATPPAPNTALPLLPLPVSSSASSALCHASPLRTLRPASAPKLLHSPPLSSVLYDDVPALDSHRPALPPLPDHPTPPCPRTPRAACTATRTTASRQRLHARNQQRMRLFVAAATSPAASAAYMNKSMLRALARLIRAPRARAQRPPRVVASALALIAPSPAASGDDSDAPTPSCSSPMSPLVRPRMSLSALRAQRSHPRSPLCLRVPSASSASGDSACSLAHVPRSSPLLARFLQLCTPPPRMRLPPMPPSVLERLSPPLRANTLSHPGSRLTLPDTASASSTAAVSRSGTAPWPVPRLPSTRSAASATASAAGRAFVCGDQASLATDKTPCFKPGRKLTFIPVPIFPLGLNTPPTSSTDAFASASAPEPRVPHITREHTDRGILAFVHPVPHSGAPYTHLPLLNSHHEPTQPFHPVSLHYLDIHTSTFSLLVLTTDLENKHTLFFSLPSNSSPLSPAHVHTPSSLLLCMTGQGAGQAPLWRIVDLASLHEYLHDIYQALDMYSLPLLLSLINLRLDNLLPLASTKVELANQRMERCWQQWLRNSRGRLLAPHCDLPPRLTRVRTYVGPNPHRVYADDIHPDRLTAASSAAFARRCNVAATPLSGSPSVACASSGPVTAVAQAADSPQSMDTISPARILPSKALISNTLNYDDDNIAYSDEDEDEHEEGMDGEDEDDDEDEEDEDASVPALVLDDQERAVYDAHEWVVADPDLYHSGVLPCELVGRTDDIVPSLCRCGHGFIASALSRTQLCTCGAMMRHHVSTRAGPILPPLFIAHRSQPLDVHCAVNRERRLIASRMYSPPVVRALHPSVFPLCYIVADRPAFLHLLVRHKNSSSKMSLVDPTGVRICTRRKDAAVQQMVEIRSQAIRRRVSFLTLCERYNDCDISQKTRGVVVDWHEQLVHPVLVRVAQTLQLGEISGIVNSAKGVHLVQKIYDGKGMLAIDGRKAVRLF